MKFKSRTMLLLVVQVLLRVQVRAVRKEEVPACLFALWMISGS